MAMFKQKQRIRGQEQDFSETEGQDPVAAEPVRDNSAGGLLRRTREEFGWELRDVAAALRIKAEYLSALERNTVEGLPGPTYATGFLRAYAEYLGLDGHEIVRRFRAEETGLHTKPELAFPVPLTDRGIPGGGIFLIAVLVCVLGYAGYYYATSGSKTTQVAVEPVPPRLLPPPPPPAPPVTVAETPKPADPLAVTPPPTPAPSGTPATAVTPTPPTPAAAHPATPPAPTPAAPSVAAATPPAPAAATTPAPTDPDAGPAPKHYGEAAAGRIVIRATGKAWIVVKDGAKPVVNTLFNKGDFYNAPDRAGLTLRTGSAGSTEVTVDGKLVPSLGPVGLTRTVPLEPDKLKGTAG
jgi:cytoskeleton protein RodZ